jgi:hypothetical protein
MIQDSRLVCEREREEKEEERRGGGEGGEGRDRFVFVDSYGLISKLSRGADLVSTCFTDTLFVARVRALKVE